MDLPRIKQTVRNNYRIPAYFALILFCSPLDFADDYKIDKRNILNQWFVKLGWFWTISLILPLLFVTIRNNDRDSVSKAIFRIISSSTLWYSSVNLFQLIDDFTGYDISGHTFLLIFSNLLISSELKLSESLVKLAKTEEKIKDNINDGTRLNNFPSVKLACLVLTVLWDFMLIQTALYYHTMLQKAVAALWAFASWYILELVFYSKAQLEVGQSGLRRTVKE